MSSLILKHANKNRLGAVDRGPNDREYAPTTHSRGYSATREQAMADFKSRWLDAVAVAAKK